MIRERTVSQENLYRQYVSLGQQVVKTSQQYDHASIQHQAWDLLTQADFWKLPVNKAYGGFGFHWRDFVSALEGLASTYINPTLDALLISHLTAIYLLLTYGSRRQKKSYLPRLMRGEKSCIVINQFSQQTSVPLHSFLTKKDENPFNLEQTTIIFLISEIGNTLQIGLFAMDRSEDLIHNIKEKRSIYIPNFYLDDSIKETAVFMSKEQGKHLLCKLINFQRLLYAMASSALAMQMIKKNKPVRSIFKGTFDGIEKRIEAAKTAFYTMSDCHQYSSGRRKDLI